MYLIVTCSSQLDFLDVEMCVMDVTQNGEIKPLSPRFYN